MTEQNVSGWRSWLSGAYKNAFRMATTVDERTLCHVQNRVAQAVSCGMTCREFLVLLNRRGGDVR